MQGVFYLKTSDFYFDLPKELIAQTPLAERSASRLLCMDRRSGSIEHKQFFEIVDILNNGDCLVINETKVRPARLIGAFADTRGAAELLLLKRIDEKSFECLVKPGKKFRIGRVIVFGDRLSATVTGMADEGNRIITFTYEGIFEEILDELGEMPLPPYIHEKLADKNRYQTVYAKNTGSAAAPTAGLHFTPEVLKKLEEKGVRIARLTLHVGLGTFRPVKVTDISEHKMHSEHYEIDTTCADIINNTKDAGGRVIAVGTTCCRTLESCADESGRITPQAGDTDIFITPGYRFRAIDGLITNFHLPESTLIMLVSAFASRSTVLNAYANAVELGYRFFSFGDAMIIL